MELRPMDFSMPSLSVTLPSFGDAFDVMDAMASQEDQMVVVDALL